MRFSISAVMTLIIIFCSCEEHESASLTVVSRHDGHTIDQAIVYLKSIGTTNSIASTRDYNFRERSDDTGEAYFNSLPPGRYSVLTVGHDSRAGNISVQGNSEVIVDITPRNKSKTIAIDTQ
jgi:hypothetical protein